MGQFCVSTYLDRILDPLTPTWLRYLKCHALTAPAVLLSLVCDAFQECSRLWLQLYASLTDNHTCELILAESK